MVSHNLLVYTCWLLGISGDITVTIEAVKLQHLSSVSAGEAGYLATGLENASPNQLSCIMLYVHC